ncbi:outer membrane beta-barrel protein [Mariniflexile litorale]|uniref:Outer membrane beta-barrel protein n=1 Tax=Mariniflexile litorale TaxID=3045158 RepID=A0AAU7EG13_9FLAO|nr:outer membrane beta-barrel protein [Mariniflexile sp. KMM 9835]MDQ8212019.1 outer membrane beta-barrel protein [Mariniflexile sp. KMM 9835]
MNEPINKKIVLKIKEQLQNHEEAYQEGAWENFLVKKKEKKRRLLYWYFRGSAASVIIILAIGFSFLKKTPDYQNDKNIITEEELKAPYNNHSKEKINKKLFNNEKTKTVKSNPNDTIHIEKNDLKNKLELNHPKKTNNNYSITNNEFEESDDSLLKNASTKYKLFNKEIKKTNIATTSSKEQTHLINKKENLNNNIKAIAFIKKPIKAFKTQPNAHLKIPLPIANYQDLLANNLEIFIETIHNNEKHEESSNNIQIGLLVSPSYGSSLDNTQSIASSNFGAGLEINIPINNSHVSFNTGTIYNTLHVTNERTTVGVYSNAKETTNLNETSLRSIDIPVNFAYNLSNNKIYLQAGISSYLTFKENTQRSSTIFREVEVFQFTDGVVETYTTTESATTKESSKNENVWFSPLGTINLSIGYRARMSNNLRYEVQPFYKYPLSTLTSEGYKIHSAGLTLKLFFSK